MSKIWIPGGGGGADLDVVTAGTSDVLSGKVIVDANGNTLTGTMPDNTSLTSNGTVPGISSSFPSVPTREGSNLQMNTATDGVVRISMCPPSGYYPGAVNDGSYVNRPASDFGNAPASAIDPDYTATSQHGINIRGTMPTMAGGTKTPSTSQITVACSGYKMTSNITIPAFSLPSASIILSGEKVTIYGKTVTGTAQQFIKTETAIKPSIFSLMSGYIDKGDNYFNLGANKSSDTPYARSNSAFNLTNYRYVKMSTFTTAGTVRVGVSSNSNGSNIRWGGWLKTGGTPIVDVSDLSGMYFVYAQGTGNGSDSSYFPNVGNKYYYSFGNGTISNS